MTPIVQDNEQPYTNSLAAPQRRRPTTHTRPFPQLQPSYPTCKVAVAGWAAAGFGAGLISRGRPSSHVGQVVLVLFILDRKSFVSRGDGGVEGRTEGRAGGWCRGRNGEPLDRHRHHDRAVGRAADMRSTRRPNLGRRDIMKRIDTRLATRRLWTV
eukprot:scaffold3808_cov112-Isochrysis_galbana.AAC.39